jgi:hypothetical protein
MNKSLTLYSASKIEGRASCHRTGGEKLHGELVCVQTTALITATTLMDAGIQNAMRFCVIKAARGANSSTDNA